MIGPGDQTPAHGVAPAYLIERSGPSQGRRHPLLEGEHLVGRGPGNSVRVESTEVSRHHAKLSVDAGGANLHDLSSKNGLWVRGQKMQGVLRMGHGDVFRAGDIEFELEHACSRAAQVLAASGEATTTTARPMGMSEPLLGVGTGVVSAAPPLPPLELSPSSRGQATTFVVLAFACLAIASWWLPW